MKTLITLSATTLAIASSLAHGQNLLAFTTSTTGKGDLHSWAEAINTSFTGLDAGDEICRVRATTAGLPNPDTFVAWLSDANTDAYCRVFGLTGKKSNSCGQNSLPLGAGPWLRTDNVPFAGHIEDATALNAIYAPLSVDEFGNPIALPGKTFTATNPLGVLDTLLDPNPHCGNWTSEDPNKLVSYGSVAHSSGGWTQTEGAQGCNEPQRLMCLQKNSGDPLSGHSQFDRREAFITSANVTGNLGGIAGADALCQNLATAADLYRPDSFKALLATSPMNTITERFQFDGPWYRRDGLLFAHNKAELVSEKVMLPLNLTETGQYIGKALVFTGSAEGSLGSPVTNCFEWTANAGTAGGTSASVVGSLFDPIDSWLYLGFPSCTGHVTSFSGDWPTKLFCLSDSDTLFHNEFETLPPSL